MIRLGRHDNMNESIPSRFDLDDENYLVPENIFLTYLSKQKSFPVIFELNKQVFEWYFVINDEYKCEIWSVETILCSMFVT